ncbi:hypothetical protein [Leptospira kmetyi]|nr:hypothetical protein [Leptospira kmetyi]
MIVITTLSCLPMRHIESYGDRQVDLVLPLSNDELFAKFIIKHYFYLNKWYFKAEIDFLSYTPAIINKIEIIRNGKIEEVKIINKLPIRVLYRTNLLSEKIEIVMTEDLLKSFVTENLLVFNVTGQYKSGKITLGVDSVNLIREYILEIDNRHQLESNWKLIKRENDSYRSLN